MTGGRRCPRTTRSASPNRSLPPTGDGDGYLCPAIRGRSPGACRGTRRFATFNDDHRHLRTATAALRELQRRRPASEDLVVCHGDYCPPNALRRGGRVIGYVDIGELAVADRWWDLALATWSTTWNFGPGLEPLFLAAYGADPDPDRQAFYRLLYDLAS